jgi:hypothetical protein
MVGVCGGDSGLLDRSRAKSCLTHDATDRLLRHFPALAVEQTSNFGTSVQAIVIFVMVKNTLRQLIPAPCPLTRWYQTPFVIPAP